MALFSECMESCTQIVLDTADIVRDGDFSPIDLAIRWFVPRQKRRTTYMRGWRFNADGMVMDRTLKRYVPGAREEWRFSAIRVRPLQAGFPGAKS